MRNTGARANQRTCEATCALIRVHDATRRDAPLASLSRSLPLFCAGKRTLVEYTSVARRNPNGTVGR